MPLMAKGTVIIMKNLIKRDKIGEVIDSQKKDGKKIVFTNGCFDILHVGHLRYLEEAKMFGDILVIGLNSDASVKRLKGDKRPIVPEEERAEMLLGLKCVDYVVIFEENTPVEILGEVKPDVHVKGGDYTKERLPEAEIVERNGGRVEIVSLIKGKSTTNIVKKIKETEE